MAIYKIYSSGVTLDLHVLSRRTSKYLVCDFTQRRCRSEVGQLQAHLEALVGAEDPAPDLHVTRRGGEARDYHRVTVRDDPQVETDSSCVFSLLDPTRSVQVNTLTLTTVFHGQQCQF